MILKNEGFTRLSFYCTNIKLVSFTPTTQRGGQLTRAQDECIGSGNLRSDVLFPQERTPDHRLRQQNNLSRYPALLFFPVSTRHTWNSWLIIFRFALYLTTETVKRIQLVLGFFHKNPLSKKSPFLRANNGF